MLFCVMNGTYFLQIGIMFEITCILFLYEFITPLKCNYYLLSMNSQDFGVSQPTFFFENMLFAIPT